ncbi:rho GTPase-activating protein 21-like isoform X3 [Daphnia pulicaria]|uniref:rho GTPase-activating protein 21-like isoform X3 n=1 Tax=Daphnia pulicaria TaxID=35523 RepID=UPI001EEA9C7D|nr:rho GTPase-activating protein 21-like isoform X3 [Daphnia pulicaria]
MMAEPSSSHSKPTVQQQQQFVANELSSSKTSTLPVRDRLNTPTQPRTDATHNSGDGRNVRGPRCITIQRSSAGFGFTLRHFIVYPPDSVSDCPEEWQRGMSAGLLDPMIPMDTIFVKHVRENGPAVKAGLSTGDQVVSVNGESVMCKSYAQVVQMIQKSGPNLQLVVMPKEHDVLQQCFADTAHNPYTNARPVIPAAGSAEDQTGKMTMMMDPLKPNNIMSHLPRPKPYQPFQVETKKPVTPQQQAGAHVQKATQQQPLGRVLSPLVTAGTTTTTTTTTAAISRPTAAASDDAAVAAQARLAAAAALVSKSVRKSADFNPNGGAAGSRGSLVGGGGGDYYPGATTGFSSSSVSAVSAVHSKRSSYAGTPTCKTEFIHSINAPAAFTSPPAAAGSVGGHARYADPSSLPHHHHHQQQQQPQQHHQFHYPVHPMEMVAAIHGSVSSLQQQQQNLRDSPLNSSKGSLYSAASECNEQQSHQQAQVMTRIKKSFEQKEEFLKRPALPYWVNVQEAQQSPPVPKEFYAQPQKFARPVWPPISASLTASLDSLSSSDVTTTPTQQQPPQQLPLQQHHKSTAVTKTEVIHTGITSMEPWSISFTSKRATPPASPSQSPGAVGLGLVPNTVPKPFYGSTNTTTTTTTTTTVTASSNSMGSPSGNKQFVSTLSRIQENIAAEPPPEPKPSRQLTLMHAPLASPEEFFTPSPTKAGQHPLAASSVATATAAASAAAAPVVVKRTKPFENGAEKGLLARIAQRGKQQQEAAAVAAAASAAAAERYSKSTSEFQRVPTGGSGNRTVIIGSSNLHCQPPAMEMEFPPNTYAASASSPSPLQLTTDLSLDENSNTSASSSIVAVSRVKKRPSHLQLTGNNQLSQQQQQQQQQQSWLVQQPPAKGPCLQTDIDADDNVSATTTTTTSTSSNNNNINCLATVDRTGSSGSPLSLPRPSPIASDFELSVLERFDQLLASLGTSSGSSSLGSSGSITVHQQQESQQSITKMTTTPAATASVNRRQKIYDDDSDRGMRRISYLKAQAGNPVDGPSLLVSATTTEAETVVTATTNTATTTTTPINNEHTAKGSTSWAVVKVETNLTMMVSAMDRVQPPVGMISRLRQYFEDKSRPPPPPPSHQRIAAATTTTNATPTPLSSTSTLASKTAAASAHPPPLAPSRRSAHQPHSIQKLRSLFGDTKVSLTSKSQQQGGGGDSSGAHPPSPSEAEGREGWLYVKQTIIDCRRSTDRSWRQMWTRIRSGTVHFTRDRNTAMASNGNNSYSSYNSNSGSTPGAGADDMMIDLRGCTVEVAVYYTKRKNVLRLSTFNGLCEYLMQCEDSSDMVLWLDSFQQEQAAANSSDKEDGPGSSYSSSEMMLVRQAHEADNNSMAHGRRMGRFTLHRNRSPTGHSPVSKTRKPSLPGTIGGGGGGGGSNSTDGPNSTPANANKPTTWRRKVVQQFKKIQGNSPNSQANAMIPEGATIGVPLEFCPRSSLSESIPLIVELCVGIVEARGLESVGVYRVPGNSVAVNALSDSLNRGFDGLNQSDPRWNDVNVISSLMKSFFRKLPDPLVTSELYGALIEASKTEPEQVRFNSIKRLVDELPEPHYSTLRYLVGHLSRVAGKSHVNKMEARNLAIVFGPTLIRPGDDSTVTMVTDMSHQCRIVETLIDKVDFFFPPDQDQPVDPVQQQQQQPNSPTTLASNSNLLSSADERKDSYAKEIVLSIITAARKKRQTSLDSPDLSERGDAAPVFPVMPVPVVVTTTASATMTTATISTTLIMAAQFSSSATVPTGSAHSLVELGSTGGQPALPVEASEFRLSTAEVPATPPTVERKRSASLGGETVMPPPSPILAMADLAGITEMGTDGLAQASGSSEPFRSRTSSGSFVVHKLHPIDAAGIRSYSGLSAVTQERIRLFEQETKAMLQRDLARQVRREGEPMPAALAGVRRLDKTEVESAWHRAKLEMETDDFLDVLADNLSEVADSTADASHKDKDNQPEQQQQQPQQQQQQAEQPKTRVDPLPVAVVMENGGADEKLLPRPTNEKEPEAVQVLPVVQKEQDNVPVAEEKLDEKPAVELQVGNAVVVKSSAGRIVAANKSTATTTTTVKQQTTIVAGVAGAVGRSQIPKPSATANKSANDPAPTGKVAAVDSAKISPTKSTMSISSSSSSAVRNRSSMAVVGRAKTVELGKSAAPPAGKKMSVGELQAPKVIRQMSAGQMQPQSPSRILPVKGNARLKSAETSPTKKASIASLNKTEETKKAATTTDGEQSKRLLESNLDEAVNISDQPRGGLKEAELADRANSKQPSVRRESKSTEVVGKGVKRSDSLTKNEKTESNTKAREREMRQTGGQKTAKKFVQRSGESGLKRRHTVGGTRDFDKVRIRWLADKSDERNVIPAPRWSAWDRLQPLISDEDLNVDRSLKTWMRSERIRTSSPELCRRSEMACATIINNSLSPPPLTDSQPLEAPSSAIRADGDVSSP